MGDFSAFDLGDYSGESNSGVTPYNLGVIGTPNVCPFLDTKKYSFCTLDGNICPFVGFDNFNCKKFQNAQNKIPGVPNTINPLDKNTTRQEDIARAAEIIAEANEDDVSAAADFASAMMAYFEGDDAAVDSKIARVLSRAGDDKKHQMEVAAKVLTSYMRRIRHARSWTDRDSYALLSHLYSVATPSTASKTVVDFTDIDDDVPGDEVSPFSSSPHEDFVLRNIRKHKSVSPRAAHIIADIANRRTRKRTSRTTTSSSHPRARGFTAVQRHSSHYASADDDMEHRGNSRRSSVTRERAVSAEEFRMFWEQMPDVVKREAQTYYSRELIRAAMDPKSGLADARRKKMLSTILSINGRHAEQELAHSHVSKTMAAAMENAVRLGKISREDYERWKSKEKEGTKVLRDTLNGVFDKYSEYEMRSMRVNGVDVPVAVVRSKYPRFTVEDLRVANAWDAVGYRVLSAYEKYGKAVGAIKTFSVIFRHFLIPYLLSAKTSLQPDTIRAISRQVPLEPILMGLWMLVRPVLPKLRVGKSEKAFMAYEKYKKGKVVDTGVPDNVAIMHDRGGVRHVNKGRKTKKTNVSGKYDWRKSHI